jgi:predicted 2-oxoglutarate/Fe(II)-dependent dioxygenase YbiX/peroxiredoxin
MLTYADLAAGDPAPWFHQRSFANPRYAFDTAAGRYIVLCFFGSGADPHSLAALDAVRTRPRFFDDANASFFAVSIDPADESAGRVADSYPGYRVLWDFDGAVSRLYGVIPSDATPGAGRLAIRRRWVVLDPTLRVVEIVPFAGDRGDIATLLDLVDSLPPPSRFAGVELPAPILVLPNVFEPEFCSTLIARFEAHGGEESGFMREVDGKTVAVHDHGHKRRRDYTIEDAALVEATRRRIRRRVVPEIGKVHQFVASRMERYIVACYIAEDRAHFRPHRDNTTKGTAHRRFAVSVLLNDDYDGGELSFPEYGTRTFRTGTGGAIVFSCSLLHAVSPVTRGRRYVFLPFLYDDAAAKLREANAAFLGDGVQPYKVGAPESG